MQRGILRTGGIAVAVWIACLILSSSAAIAQRPERLETPTQPEDFEIHSAVTFYLRANYVWPFAKGPFYGRAANSASREAGVLVTRVGTFRIGSEKLPIPEELTAPPVRSRQAPTYSIVQFDPARVNRTNVREFVQRVESVGGRLVRHLPVASVVVRIDDRGLAEIVGLEPVIAVEPFHPAFKLDPTIGRVPHIDREYVRGDRYDLDVVLFRGEEVAAVADALRGLGAEIIATFAGRIRVRIPRGNLFGVARIESVEAVFEHRPFLPMAQKTTYAVQTGTMLPGGDPFHAAGVRGRGQVLGVIDNGLQLDAADLSTSASSPGIPGSGHRKVAAYYTAEFAGGSGDLSGCDAPAQGGYTHGHVVTATAVGNANHEVQSFVATDDTGATWSLDGVAPDALVAFVDAQITPTVGDCDDPLLGELDPGDLYVPGAGLGVLDRLIESHAAKVLNLSFGDPSNVYGVAAEDVDEFMFDRRDAIVVVPVGNLGSYEGDRDPYADPGTATDVATAKNALVVGAHGGPDDHNDPGNIDERARFSASGPPDAIGRVAPVLLAPGQERGSSGPDSEFACRTSQNDSNGPVSCDVVTGRYGTSLSSAAAAGAALLVRDWFALGFHPDGTQEDPQNDADRVHEVSGGLVKAVLIASAEFIGRGFSSYYAAPFDNLRFPYRFNIEQGYGRIQLDNVLPLSNWSASPSGLLVVDGGIASNDLRDLGSDLPGTIDAIGGATQESTFEVCDDTRELRVALAWVEASGDALLNDLDLELVSPSGREYFGNYFTDDDNRDGVIDTLHEDCPSMFDDGQNFRAGVDESEWSLETCIRGNGQRSPHDATNPTEAIFLSPNPEGNVDAGGAPLLRDGMCTASGDPCGYSAHCGGQESCTGGTAQVETGTWTVRIKARPGGSDGEQPYAFVISGGVCTDSSIRFDRTHYACRDAAVVTVSEIAESADPAQGLTPSEVAARTEVQVIDADVNVLDSEDATSFGFEISGPHALQFVSGAVPLSSSTAHDSGNGVMDVMDGNRLRVVYHDRTEGVADPAKMRISSVEVDCVPRMIGGLTFDQFGQDESFLLQGGCERSQRGLFEYGFPDRYMDAGEVLSYRVGFASTESVELVDVEANLRCVQVDADSPPGCPPGSDACPDPDRENNSVCVHVTVLDSPKSIELLPAYSATTSNFTIRIDDLVVGTPEVEMVLELSSPRTGRSASVALVQRHRLDVDAVSKFYSTDFPFGGVEILERNNNGVVENPRTTGAAGAPHALNTDYWFETRIYSDLTACRDAAGTAIVCNDSLQSPWSFDVGDGGFRSGIHAETTDSEITDVIAHWGEDKNFNNVLDGRCVGDPAIACDRFPADPINCDVDSDFLCEHLEDRLPENFPVPKLDQNWSTEGGCGWQTRAPRTCQSDPTRSCYLDTDCGETGPCVGPGAETGGIWHTGRIGSVEDSCVALEGEVAACSLYDTIGGTQGRLVWWELLLTPVIEKVDQSLDTWGQPVAKAEITAWDWNQAIDLPDNHTAYTVAFDTDVDRIEPVDPLTDSLGSALSHVRGEYGALSSGGNPFLTRGWSLFAPIDPATHTSRNGTVGGNREGRNACLFEGGAVRTGDLDYAGLAGPPDDDAPEGYCPSGANPIGGLDPHLDYCTTVCSRVPDVPCSSDVSCSGTCINPGLAGFCSNSPTIPCIDSSECNIGTCVDIVCNGECEGGRCTHSGASCGDDEDCTEACVFTRATIDEFVQPNGPVRNHDLSAFNGPDMRRDTLEDRYGDTGNRFQGALGFRTTEADRSPDAQRGYGLGVDDMVVTWREYTLEQDASLCSVSGACASIELDASTIYDGNGRIGITVVEPSPIVNDCDLDGAADGTHDCNGNGTDDVIVRVKSAAEPDGEVVVLDRTGESVYHATFPISSSFDMPGVLFVSVDSSSEFAEVTATYTDHDDGTGRICANHVETELQGLVQASAEIRVVAGHVVVTRSVLSDNGDDDGWADTGETVTMRVEVANRSGINLTGLTLRASSASSEIDCVTLPFIDFGDLASGESRISDAGFEFVVSSTLERADPTDELFGTLQITLDANEIQAANDVQEVTFNLDLDATGGSGPTMFLESFETALPGGPFGSFVGMEIDRLLNPPDFDPGNDVYGTLNSDGYRCQYSNPDWHGSVVYDSWQSPTCYLNPNNQPDRFFWETATERGFTGTKSLHWGAWIDASLGYSTPTAQLEAVRLDEPVNLGWSKVCDIDRTTFCEADADCPSPGGQVQACVAASPTLSFKHQVSLMDSRTVSAQYGRGADRAVVHGQLADDDGNPVGDWIKLYPFVNSYDSMANSNYFNCSFDPIDDGNDEDDYFDPTDPMRSRGPSSTCAPELNFVAAGHTLYSSDSGRPNLLERAPDGPPLDGAHGPGSWVEPVFDLDRFRGRRMRIRFLATSLKLGSFVLWENAFVFNPDPRDDGWFIDDVTITDTLATPATVTADTKDNSALPGCGETCGAVQASVSCNGGSGAAIPCATSSVPGEVVELDAGRSVVDRCIGGVLQYRFWLDADRNGSVESGVDQLLRDWSDNSRRLVAPQGAAAYLVEVRCGTDPTCVDTAAASIEVDCPTGPSGLIDASTESSVFLAANAGAERSIVFTDGSSIVWPSAGTVDVVRGSLDRLRADGTFTDAVGACLLDDATGSAGLVVPQDPAPGSGFFYLARSARYCNERAGGSYGGVGETGRRDGGIESDPDRCP